MFWALDEFINMFWTKADEPSWNIIWIWWWKKCLVFYSIVTGHRSEFISIDYVCQKISHKNLVQACVVPCAVILNCLQKVTEMLNVIVIVHWNSCVDLFLSEFVNCEIIQINKKYYFAISSHYLETIMFEMPSTLYFCLCLRSTCMIAQIVAK